MRYNEEAKALANLIKDKNRLKIQIAGSAQVSQIGKFTNESLRVIPRTIIVKDTGIGHAWVIGHPTNGKIGTSATGVDGELITVETGQATSELKRVINYNQKFVDRFRFNAFEGTTTTATTNYTTNTVGFNEDEEYVSKTIFRDQQNVVSAKISAEGTNVSNITFYLSCDGGSNWEVVTLDEDFSFTTPDNELQWKGVASGGSGLFNATTLFDFENDSVNWSELNPGHNLGDDSTTYKVGSGSMSINVTSYSPSPEFIWNDLANTKDLSSYSGVSSGAASQGGLGFYLYVPTSGSVSSISLTLHSPGASGTDYVRYSASSFTTGWNFIVFDLTTPSFTYGTIDWTNISRFEFDLNVTATGTYNLDEMQISTIPKIAELTKVSVEYTLGEDTNVIQIDHLLLETEDYTLKEDEYKIKIDE